MVSLPIKIKKPLILKSSFELFSSVYLCASSVYHTFSVYLCGPLCQFFFLPVQQCGIKSDLCLGPLLGKMWVKKAKYIVSLPIKIKKPLILKSSFELFSSVYLCASSVALCVSSFFPSRPTMRY